MTINNLEKFVTRANILHNNKYGYTKSIYLDTFTPLIVTCYEHGDFLVKPKSHLCIKKTGCPACGKLSYIKKRSFTTEQFIEKSNKVHNNYYTYPTTNYINHHEKVNIICPVHGEFSQVAGEHMRGRGCYSCGMKTSSIKQIFSNEKCLEKFIKIHGERYGYELVDYKGANEPVDIVCRKHGIFSQVSSLHWEGKNCPKCSIEKQRMTYDYFLETAKKIYGGKYEYHEEIKGKFTSSESMVKIYCVKHQFYFKQLASTHLTNIECCPKCRIDNLKTVNLLTQEKFIERCKLIHNNYYSYPNTNYTGGKNKVDIVCPVHGEFSQLAMIHITGSGCKYCATSKTEKLWVLSLNNPNIKTNETLRIGGKTIRPDGIDYTTNTVYEYHGDYWHGNPNVYNRDDINGHNKKTFGELYDVTMGREKLLKSNGYNVITMWESEYKQSLKNNTK